jgi:PAS domain S-box-containing protein
MKVVSQAQRYGLALICCAAALMVARRVDAPSSSFFLAVMVSSLYGGKGPGLLSVGLSALAFDYFFLPTPFRLALDPPSSLRFAMFLGATMLITVLIEIKRRVEESSGKINAQYRAVADTAPDAIISIDGNARILFVNPAATRIFGWNETAMVGQSLTVFLPNFELAECLPGGEFAGRRKDGTEFPAEVSFGAVSGSDPGFFTGFVRDISKRKQAEAALRKTQERLSRATQIATVGELAAAIAHEVNQPLGAVVANGHACLRWLSAVPPNLAKAQQAAERIVRDGKDAGAVVQRVRALFKRTAEEKAVLDLNEIIGEVLRTVLGDTAKKQIVVETELDRNLPSVVGDRIQLQQVFLNLLNNGVEAMDGIVDRPKKLFVRSAREYSDAVIVEIRDHGTGMEDPEKAFEAFFTTKENGMGMGLAISRTIIDAHHGRLWVASNEGPGTTVCFRIPLQSSESQ